MIQTEKVHNTTDDDGMMALQTKPNSLVQKEVDQTSISPHLGKEASGFWHLSNVYSGTRTMAPRNLFLER